MPATPADKPDKPDKPDPTHDLQRVRDLLFGNDLRQGAQQLAEVERRAIEAITALRRELAAEIAAGQERLTAAVAQLQATFRRDREQLAADLEEKIERLREGKLERDELAGMLTGIADRIARPNRVAGD